MKTKILKGLIVAAMMFGTSSCYVGVHARAGHRDRDYVQPEDNGRRNGFITPVQSINIYALASANANNNSGK